MNDAISLETLESKYWELLSRVQGINHWIENNLATDPNFYEMVDCRVEFCELTHRYNEYYTKVGYPMIEENGRKRQSNSYDLFKLVPQLYEIRSELNDMYEMRKDSPFFQDELPNRVLSELDRRAYTADFAIPEMGENSMAIPQVAGVYFYIWQQQQHDPNFRYSNEAEYQAFKQKLESMKEKGDYYMDDLVDVMVNGIEKNSTFYEAEYSTGMSM